MSNEIEEIETELETLIKRTNELQQKKAEWEQKKRETEQSNLQRSLDNVDDITTTLIEWHVITDTSDSMTSFSHDFFIYYGSIPTVFAQAEHISHQPYYHYVKTKDGYELTNVMEEPCLYVRILINRKHTLFMEESRFLKFKKLIQTVKLKQQPEHFAPHVVCLETK
jgi:hypothetical protein